MRIIDWSSDVCSSDLQVADDVRACLGDLVFSTVIPRTVRLSEAPSHGVPALIYDFRCSGSEAYMRLARELIARLPRQERTAEHTSELQSLMRISYAVFCLKKKINKIRSTITNT